MDNTNTSSVTEKLTSEEPIIGSDRTFTSKHRFSRGDSEQAIEETFRFKVPTIVDLLNIDILTSSLIKAPEGAEVPPAYLTYAFMLATLKTCMIESPTWFSCDSIDEIEVLEELYSAYATVIESFRKKSRVKVVKP